MFLITGGGSGIGRALAHAMAGKNKKVLIIGRRAQALAETAAFSPLISYLQADVTTQEGRERISHHLAQTPSLEGLVNNAGLIEPIAPLTKVSESACQTI